tara:strand:+ start:44770 stop:45210 length:441 start_codon:yes stop_codon:yes gene_type:complete
MKALFSIILILVSHYSFGTTVTIFTNDAHPVQIDIELASDVVFPIDNLDSMAHAKLALNEAVTKRVQLEPDAPAPERYKKAFMSLLNSNEWASHETALETGSNILLKAVKMRVQKVPAIVFDGKYVIYGVTSLKEAVDIYQRSVNR